MSSNRSPLTCPNGHAMDEGLFHCPACGAYRPSATDPNALIRNGRVVGVKTRGEYTAPTRNTGGAGMTKRQLEAVMWLESVGKASERLVRRDGFAVRTLDTLADQGFVRRDLRASYRGRAIQGLSAAREEGLQRRVSRHCEQPPGARDPVVMISGEVVAFERRGVGFSVVSNEDPYAR